jgi:hypothetical protein
MTNPPDQNALNSRNSTASVATRSETDTYLASIRKRRTSVGTGRLIFALDATASRRPTWETACQLSGPDVRGGQNDRRAFGPAGLLPRPR